MNLDGHDISLKLIEEVRPQKKLLQVGDSIIKLYSYGKYFVKVKLIFLTVCSPTNDNCEFEWMESIITIKNETRTEMVKAQGGCGCG